VVRRLIDQRAKRRLELAMLDADRHVARQRAEGSDLPTEVLHTPRVVLDEQENELHAREAWQRRVRAQRVEHDERRPRLARGIAAGAGEPVNEEEPGGPIL